MMRWHGAQWHDSAWGDEGDSPGIQQGVLHHEDVRQSWIVQPVAKRGRGGDVGGVIVRGRQQQRAVQVGAPEQRDPCAPQQARATLSHRSSSKRPR